MRKNEYPELRKLYDRGDRILHIAIGFLVFLLAFGILWYFQAPKRLHEAVYDSSVFIDKTDAINGHPYRVTIESPGGMLEVGRRMNLSAGSNCRSVMMVRFKFDLDNPGAMASRLELLKKRGVVAISVAPRAIGIEKDCLPEEGPLSRVKPFWTWDDIWKDVFSFLQAELGK